MESHRSRRSSDLVTRWLLVLFTFTLATGTAYGYEFCTQNVPPILYEPGSYKTRCDLGSEPAFTAAHQTSIIAREQNDMHVDVFLGQPKASRHCCRPPAATKVRSNVSIMTSSRATAAAEATRNFDRHHRAHNKRERQHAANETRHWCCVLILALSLIW